MPQIEQSVAGSLLVTHGCIGQEYSAPPVEGRLSPFLPKKNQSVSPISTAPPMVTKIAAKSMTLTPFHTESAQPQGIGDNAYR